MKSDDALNYVRSRRSIVNPNPGFWNQLKQYEKILFQRKARGSGTAMMPAQQQHNKQVVNPNVNMGYNYGTGGNMVYTQPIQQVALDPFGFGGFGGFY